MREALLHLAARVLEDLQGGLGDLLVVHLEAAQQGLEGFGRVEGHRVGEGEDLGDGGTGDGHFQRAQTNLTLLQHKFVLRVILSLAIRVKTYSILLSAVY